MARIRALKPDFFAHEGLASVSPHARLAFAGLWIHADREGRLKDAPGRLRALIFPYEPQVDMVALLNELERIHVAVRYDVDGVRYLELPGFLEHQRPHPREPVSVIPPRLAVKRHGEPCKDTASPGCIPEASRPVPDTSGTGRVDLDLDLDLDRGRERGTAPPPAAPVPLRPLTAKRNGNAEFEHPRFDVPTWWHLEAARGLSDGERRLTRFYAWLSARVERTNEDTMPRKEWLNRCLAEWLAESKPSASAVPNAEETQRMLAAKRAGAGS